MSEKFKQGHITMAWRLHIKGDIYTYLPVNKKVLEFKSTMNDFFLPK